MIRVDTDPKTGGEEYYPTGACAFSEADATEILKSHRFPERLDVAFKMVTPAEFSELMNPASR